MERQWKDNPFWDNEEKTRLKAILVITDDNGQTTSQVVTVNKFNGGVINDDWIDILETIGEDKIDANTLGRINKRKEEEEARRLKEKDIENSKKLEKLFEAKLQAFEIEEIKNSTNRDIKSKLRRSKSMVEVNLYAMMILMEAIENETQD